MVTCVMGLVATSVRSQMTAQVPGVSWNEGAIWSLASAVDALAVKL
jgi:hypothetical protein